MLDVSDSSQIFVIYVNIKQLTNKQFIVNEFLLLVLNLNYHCHFKSTNLINVQIILSTSKLF